MGVYLPTAAVGNGRVLCTLGGAGEVMGFFYPHVDFAQNVRELLPALYLGDPGRGRFVWLFDGEFQRHQEYLPGTNVVRTRLQLSGQGVEVTLTDFCPPGSTALVRRVAVRAPGDFPLRGTFFTYFDLRLHEVTGKQSVRYMAQAGIALQWFRDIAVAVGGEPASVWRCGKSIDNGPRSAKSDLYDGHLNGQPEDIGQVDFALGWHLNLGPGETRQFDVVLVAGPSREQAIAQVQELSGLGGAELERRTAQGDRLWLQARRRPAVAPRLLDAYDRALLSLRILQDRDNGAVIAAPEFDPAYELCGGYGYCWPRDATEAVMALRAAGEPDALHRLCRWYLTTQLPSGHWGQRYWSDGLLASSWALREDFLQVDQTAAAVIALCQAGLSTDAQMQPDLVPGAPPAPQGTGTPSAGVPAGPLGLTSALGRGALLGPQESAGGCPPPPPSELTIPDRASGPTPQTTALWPAIKRGAQALAAMVGEDGWHGFACDLWETFCGSFVYTNAAIYAALRAAARVATVMNEADLVADWEETCERLKQATVAAHNGQHFPRGLTAEGHADLIVDSSTLGVSEPFGMLSPQVPRERALIESNLRVIEERLNWIMPDGSVGIRRYEGDGYLGGVIGCVNTLWFALVCLQLARSYLTSEPDQARYWRDKAVGYIEFCLNHATGTGLLPELIGTRAEYPYWAAPHSWASGLLVKCVLELDELEGAGRATTAARRPDTAGTSLT